LAVSSLTLLKFGNGSKTKRDSSNTTSSMQKLQRVSKYVSFFGVLTLDCSSSSSVFLLACLAGTASLGRFRRFFYGIDMVTQRANAKVILTFNTEAPNGLVSVFNDPKSRSSPCRASSLAL
jgi:hypothetical protein